VASGHHRQFTGMEIGPTLEICHLFEVREA
jgi:hypothetical protein